ncbi:cell division protein SepF [Arsenicicoccus sp. oral taxon 190]|uniref:cell division protein SepF n=1 Tax=Arsenicicoccus sp. oral taxon 190 TaxID=1658671 RepID=UPI00067A0934|nr:cell division protein SepF [Arsenicicoccus sp. oral taxon 190]AKT51643.1 cell division protein SepF [Arsenicicoccus sp. oral taxon 190]
MAGALRKTMVYLGLAEDDYESYDYDKKGQDERAGGQQTRTEPRLVESGREERRSEGATAVREERHASVAHLPQRTPVARVVRDPEVGPMNRITTIHPRTYNEAKTIGESFREGIPVIMNLGDMADDDAKRLVDFAAGLVFGLNGAIERVTSKVFLLTPQHVEVSTEESEAPAAARGFFNQS